jgi:phosphohistidine phosphatase
MFDAIIGSFASLGLRMKLYVMRHGPAEDSAESGRDFDRALTASGRDRVRGVAQLLVDESEAPLAIVTSPLVRSVQTAEIVAVVTNLEGTVETHHALAPGGDAAALARSLAAAQRKRVMFVGHEPDVSELVVRLLGKSMGQPFEKAMVVGLALNDDKVKMRFVLEPKEQELIRGGDFGR